MDRFLRFIFYWILFCTICTIFWFLFIYLFTILVDGSTEYLADELTENLAFSTTTILRTFAWVANFCYFGSFRLGVSFGAGFFWVVPCGFSNIGFGVLVVSGSFRFLP